MCGGMSGAARGHTQRGARGAGRGQFPVSAAVRVSPVIHAHRAEDTRARNEGYRRLPKVLQSRKRPWLKAPTSTFTFKTYHKRQAAIRHQPTCPL